eukprot:g2951.t1
MVCPYRTFGKARTYFSSVARSLPRESRTMCSLDWYHRTVLGCKMHPLSAVRDSTKVLGGIYAANVKFNQTFTSPDVYIFLFTNCEMRGYRGAALRSCPSTNLVAYVENDNGNKGGEHISSYTDVNEWKRLNNINCTLYEQAFDGFDLEVGYTFRNPDGWLSTTDLPYISMYSAIMYFYSTFALIWVINTYVFKTANGILLQWHMAPILVVKAFVAFLNWQYYINTNLNRPTLPLLNVVAQITHETLLYETLIRLSKGWMITMKNFTRKEVLQLYLILCVFFVGKIFSTIFAGNQFLGGTYTNSQQPEGLSTAMYVFTIIALGVSYLFILMVVWVASINRTKELSLQLEALYEIDPSNENLESTPQYIKSRLFQYYRWSFTIYLFLNAFTWFYVQADRDVRVYYPYVQHLIDEVVEFIFVGLIFFIFRARKFNIIIVTFGDALNARFGRESNQIVPLSDAVRTANLERSKASVVFVNPDNNGSIGAPSVLRHEELQQGDGDSSKLKGIK